MNKLLTLICAGILATLIFTIIPPYVSRAYLPFKQSVSRTDTLQQVIKVVNENNVLLTENNRYIKAMYDRETKHR